LISSENKVLVKFLQKAFEEDIKSNNDNTHFEDVLSYIFANIFLELTTALQLYHNNITYRRKFIHGNRSH